MTKNFNHNPLLVLIICNHGPPIQRRYRASGSKEHVSMERGACEHRAPKQIKIGNSYSQIRFPNFVGEKEEKSLSGIYYRVPYNR